MYEPIGAKGNRVKDKSLPKHMLLSKCPSSEIISLDDDVTFKIKALSQGSMLGLRMGFKRITFFIYMDDDKTAEFGNNNPQETCDS